MFACAAKPKVNGKKIVLPPPPAKRIEIPDNEEPEEDEATVKKQDRSNPDISGDKSNQSINTTSSSSNSSANITDTGTAAVSSVSVAALATTTAKLEGQDPVSQESNPVAPTSVAEESRTSTDSLTATSVTESTDTNTSFVTSSTAPTTSDSVTATSATERAGTNTSVVTATTATTSDSAATSSTNETEDTDTKAITTATSTEQALQSNSVKATTASISGQASTGSATVTNTELPDTIIEGASVATSVAARASSEQTVPTYTSESLEATTTGSNSGQVTAGKDKSSEELSNSVSQSNSARSSSESASSKVQEYQPEASTHWATQREAKASAAEPSIVNKLTPASENINFDGTTTSTSENKSAPLEPKSQTSGKTSVEKGIGSSSKTSAGVTTSEVSVESKERLKLSQEKTEQQRGNATDRGQKTFPGKLLASSKSVSFKGPSSDDNSPGQTKNQKKAPQTASSEVAFEHVPSTHSLPHRVKGLTKMERQWKNRNDSQSVDSSDAGRPNSSQSEALGPRSSSPVSIPADARTSGETFKGNKSGSSIDSSQSKAKISDEVLEILADAVVEGRLSELGEEYSENMRSIAADPALTKKLAVTIRGKQQNRQQIDGDNSPTGAQKRGSGDSQVSPHVYKALLERSQKPSARKTTYVQTNSDVFQFVTCKGTRVKMNSTTGESDPPLNALSTRELAEVRQALLETLSNKVSRGEITISSTHLSQSKQSDVDAVKSMTKTLGRGMQKRKIPAKRSPFSSSRRKSPPARKLTTRLNAGRNEGRSLSPQSAHGRPIARKSASPRPLKQKKSPNSRNSSQEAIQVDKFSGGTRDTILSRLPIESNLSIGPDSNSPPKSRSLATSAHARSPGKRDDDISKQLDTELQLLEYDKMGNHKGTSPRKSPQVEYDRMGKFDRVSPQKSPRRNLNHRQETDPYSGHEDSPSVRKASPYKVRPINKQRSPTSASSGNDHFDIPSEHFSAPRRPPPDVSYSYRGHDVSQETNGAPRMLPSASAPRPRPSFQPSQSSSQQSRPQPRPQLSSQQPLPHPPRPQPSTLQPRPQPSAQPRPQPPRPAPRPQSATTGSVNDKAAAPVNFLEELKHRQNKNKSSSSVDASQQSRVSGVKRETDKDEMEWNQQDDGVVITVVGPEGPLKVIMKSDGSFKPLSSTQPDTPSPVDSAQELGTSDAEAQSPKAEERQKRGKKPKEAPPSGQLGGFMYVRNSNFENSLAAGDPHSPDNPKYWVGRVVEIMRTGYMRLHWHRELSLGSGMYIPTNSYFPEKASLLQSIEKAVWLKDQKAWQISPVIEENEEKESSVAPVSSSKASPDLNRPTVASKSTDESEGAQNVLTMGNSSDFGTTKSTENVENRELTREETLKYFAPGKFVIMRNSMFDPQEHSVYLPKYWICRIDSIQSYDEDNLPAELYLQWFQETELNSNLFKATPSYFSEDASLARPLPGGDLRYDSRTGYFYSPGSVSLVFPGDEDEEPQPPPKPPMHVPKEASGNRPVGNRITEPTSSPKQASVDRFVDNELAESHDSTRNRRRRSSTVSSAGESTTSPGDVISVEAEDVQPGIGGFAFIPNAKFQGWKTESVTNPRFFVMRIDELKAPPSGLQPPPGLPGSSPLAKLTWFRQTETQGLDFEPTGHRFEEAIASLHPLPDMVKIGSADNRDLYRLQGPYNTALRFSVNLPADQLTKAKAPLPVIEPGEDDEEFEDTEPFPRYIKVVPRRVELSKAFPANLNLYMIMKLAFVKNDKVKIRKESVAVSPCYKTKSSQQTWEFNATMFQWHVMYDPNEKDNPKTGTPNSLAVQLWDAGPDSQGSPSPSAAGHAFVASGLLGLNTKSGVPLMTSPDLLEEVENYIPGVVGPAQGPFPVDNGLHPVFDDPFLAKKPCRVELKQSRDGNVQGNAYVNAWVIDDALPDEEEEDDEFAV